VTSKNHSLRICLPTGIFPPDVGGPASYVPRIAAAWQGRGDRVTVITLADEKNLLLDYPFSLLRIFRGMPRLRRMATTISTIFRSAKKSDIVFANGLFIEAALAAALARKPLVMKIVGDWAWERARNNGQGSGRLEDFQSRRQTLRWEFVKALRSVVTRRANLVIAPSHYLASIVMDWGVPSEKISVVYNALDPLPEDEPVSLPAFSGSTLITVARLVNWKGIDGLIRCVAPRADLRLVIVGDGPERNSLLRMVEEGGAKERILFTGNISREQVAGYLRAADLFVLNSLYEGLPHIILEAFAANIPVIATAAGGTPEIITAGENGLLIPPADDNALSAAIRRLEKDPALRTRLAAAGRQSLTRMFRWDVLVEETRTLLSAAAGISQ
jgi:glycosyltransferase involved in cell wall biosynthesis